MHLIDVRVCEIRVDESHLLHVETKQSAKELVDIYVVCMFEVYSLPACGGNARLQTFY
jgi:hypothetical protein